jgi:hypothetical protein
MDISETVMSDKQNINQRTYKYIKLTNIQNFKEVPLLPARIIVYIPKLESWDFLIDQVLGKYHTNK